MAIKWEKLVRALISESAFRKLAARAKAEQRSISAYVRIVLYKHLGIEE